MWLVVCLKPEKFVTGCFFETGKIVIGCFFEARKIVIGCFFEAELVVCLKPYMFTKLLPE